MTTYDATKTRSMIAIAALGVGFALLADCKRDAATEQAHVQAEQIENRGEQQADRLRDQARATENTTREQGRVQAEQMRQQADQIRDQAHRQANAVEQGAENRANNRNGVVPAQGQGGGPVIAAHITLARETYAAARCDREVRCSNIGAGRRYASREACLQTARTDRNDSWDGLVPNVVEIEVAVPLSAIGRSRCLKKGDRHEEECHRGNERPRAERGVADEPAADCSDVQRAA